MRYLPHTESEVREMLAAIGVSSIDDLFEPIPAALRAGKLPIDPALDEAALMAHLEKLADRNEAARDLSFLGGGMYDHHIPPAVDQLLMRSEFYTAYTPYQGEVSQGTLQAIYEFQTMVCELFDMDVANASMYDAASAAAEAVLMARRVTRKRKTILVSGALHPHAIDTIRTYLTNLDDGTADMVVTGITEDGRTDLDSVKDALGAEPAALIVGYPNFLGCVEDLEALGVAIHGAGGLLITSTTEPYALSLVKAPGSLGADICVGEGQALAVPPQFGGPGVGLFACRQKMVRQMPGRLVGETVDETGKPCFVLTLSTREQHIRRERATSNICTNHGLIALAFAIRTAMLGRSGFVEVGTTCLRAASYLASRIRELEGYELPYGAPHFNELVVRRQGGKAAPMLATLAAQGILAGIDLGPFRPEWDHDFLVAVTEKHSRDDIDRLIEALSV